MSDSFARSLSPAGRRHAILSSRTRRLARRRAAPEPVASVPSLVCEVSGQLFGFPLTRVARVLPAVRMASVPSSNPALLGVMSRAGLFYQVYDLALLAGAGGSKPDGHVVLLRRSGGIAFRVDRALRVADLVAASAADSPHLQGSNPITAGFARPLQPDLFEGRIIALIDSDKIAPDQAPGHVEGD